MKKLIIGIFLILSLLGSTFIMPYDVSAKEAETIKDLKDELAALKQEKINTQNQKTQTQSQIESNKNAIYSAYQEQEDIKVKIVEAENKIVESNEKIVQVKDQTGELLRFYQLSNGENAYVEYISGASDVTDFIMRTAIVEQISKYNKQLTEELKALIAENEQLKIDLANRNIELENKKVEYQQAINRLGTKLTELNEINEDIDDQIKNQQELIKYYQSVCSSETQLLSDCIDLAYSSQFIMPLKSGRVTSDWGYRKSPINGKLKFHNAIDIGGNAEGTPVYAAAAGMVAAITKKSSCGGNIVYIHHNVNGKYYTTQYAHLLSYNVKVGDKVTATTQIGAVGGGKKTTWDNCSTGAHLHFGISEGHYLGAGKDSYSSWSKFISKSVDPKKYLPFKSRWSSRY